MVNIVISWNDDHGNSLALQKAQLFRQLFMVDFLPVLCQIAAQYQRVRLFFRRFRQKCVCDGIHIFHHFSIVVSHKIWNASPKSVISGD